MLGSDCSSIYFSGQVFSLKALGVNACQLKQGCCTEEGLTSREPCVPVTDREKRSTEPAKVTLMPPQVPEANLTLPTSVSGEGNFLLTVAEVADASSTSPNPAWQRTTCHNEHPKTKSFYSPSDSFVDA